METTELTQRAINPVNAKHGLPTDLILCPVRIDHVNKGHSYTIANEILKVVNSCRQSLEQHFRLGASAP